MLAWSPGTKGIARDVCAQPPPAQQPADNWPAKEIDFRNRFVRRHRLSPGRPDVGDVDSMLDARAVCDGREDQQHPVTRHGKDERHIVHAGRSLDGVCEHGCHAGVRHVSFEAHPCAFDRSACLVLKCHRQGCGTDDRRRRAQGPCHVQWWTGAIPSSAAGEVDHQRHDPEHRQNPPAAVFHAAASHPAACCAHAHCGRPFSAAGGNR